jgi:hypothetical protein
MSRRANWLRPCNLPAWLVVPALVLALIATAYPAGLAGAQSATPAATVAATAAPAGTAGVTGVPGTPTPTRTPTTTPSPTPTLTELDARLLLAQTYLDGKDYDTAAELFGDIAADTRGDPRALAGLNQALQGQASITATQMAPFPGDIATPVPAATPVPPATFTQAARSKLIEIGAWVLAAIVVVLALYFLAALIRRALAWLREFWYMRVLPLLGRPAVRPGFLIGDFANMLGDDGAGPARIVPIAVTEKLIAWNQLVQDKQVPVEIAPDMDLGAMAWIRVFWNWLLPRERGYRVTGTILNGAAGAYQLAVQRTNLARNSVDRSAIFERRDSSAEAAFRMLAGEAAKWLVAPDDLEADNAVAAAARAAGEAQPLPASQVFDEALSLLLPVRQQVNQGLVDFPDARRRLSQAEAMIARLPSNSTLRAELQRVVEGLRKSIPAG